MAEKEELKWKHLVERILLTAFVAEHINYKPAVRMASFGSTMRAEIYKPGFWGFPGDFLGTVSYNPVFKSAQVRFYSDGVPSEKAGALEKLVGQAMVDVGGADQAIDIRGNVIYGRIQRTS